MEGNVEMSWLLSFTLQNIKLSKTSCFHCSFYRSGKRKIIYAQDGQTRSDYGFFSWYTLNRLPLVIHVEYSSGLERYVALIEKNITIRIIIEKCNSPRKLFMIHV